MFKGVDIGIQQMAYCILISEYVLLSCNRNKQQHTSRKTVLVPFHWDGHKSCYLFQKKLFFGLVNY